MSYQVLSKEQLDHVLARTSPHSFKFNVARMHEIYRLPINDEPTLDPAKLGDTAISRLNKFKQTLLDEVDEVTEIITKLEAAEAATSHKEQAALAQDALTDIADWLSDIIVYCRSEGMKFGLPIEETLEAVMGSNFTKVGDVPVYDENGKVQKDLSRFIPPESAIKTILFGF
jgi:hypothetical protein